METFQKIKEIREKKRISRAALYQKLKSIFGAKAIKPNSIWRIESGLTVARTSSLHQICVGLGVSLKEILGEPQTKTQLIELLTQKQRLEQFVYDAKARAEILSSATLPFLAAELVLSPGAVTKAEEDPIEIAKFVKWVYCLSGKFDCFVGTEIQTLSKGDCLSFASNLPHHFGNPYTRKARGLVIQDPKHI